MEVLRIADTPKETPVRDMIDSELWNCDLDFCMTCGACSGGCPVADFGEEGLDPRKVVRMIAYGLEDEVRYSDWIWQCTNCQRCTHACPQGINIGNLITVLRGSIERDKTPGEIQKTCNNHYEVNNNMRLTIEDWEETTDWMAEELQMEIPDFKLPLEVKGAEYFCTINSKLPQYYPMHLQHIYKVFHAAKASWTMPKEWWEGTNYCMFTGDFETWEKTLRKQVDKLHELGCKTMLYTE